MSRLTKNIIYNLLGKGLIIILSLFSVKYLFQGLGEDVFGIIAFITTLDAILLSSFDKGISSTTIREISGNIKKNKIYVSSFLQTWSIVCWFSYITLVVLIFFLAPLCVDKWIHLESLDSKTAIFMLRILGSASLLTLPNSFYTSIHNGMQRMEFPNLISFTMRLLQQIGIILIMSKVPSVILIIYWISFCYILSMLASLIISGRLTSFRSLLPILSINVVKKNAKFGLQMSAISILSIFQKQVDKVTISKLLPIGFLGYYSFIFNNLQKGMMVSQSISRAAYPDLCEKFNNCEHEAMLKQYNKLQDFICYINVPIFIALPFVAQPLLTYVFNSDVAKNLQLPVVFLSIGCFLNSTLSLPYRILLAVGRPYIAVKFNFYALFITVPLIIIFTYLWKLNGASLGWVFYFLFGYFYFIPRVYKQCIGIPTYIFFKNLLKLFILVCITYGLSFVCLKAYANINIIHHIIGYFIGSIIFFSLAYFFVGIELKELVARFVISNFKKVGVN